MQDVDAEFWHFKYITITAAMIHTTINRVTQKLTMEPEKAEWPTPQHQWRRRAPDDALGTARWAWCLQTGAQQAFQT